MKSRLLALSYLLLSAVTDAQTVRLSEPVSSDAGSEIFGQVLDETLKPVKLAMLVEQPEDFMTEPFVLETRIAKVCQRKGCFFIAQQNEHMMRVSFRDYGFFIPTDSSGKTVQLAGQLVAKERSPEQTAHFQADLKCNSDEVQAGKVYEIVADSIRIPITTDIVP